MSYIVRVTNRSTSTEYTVPAGESRIVSENLLERIDLDSDDKIKTIEFLSENDNSLASSGTSVTVAAYTPPDGGVEGVYETAFASDGTSQVYIGDVLDTSLSDQDQQNGWDEFGTPTMRITISKSDVQSVANGTSQRFDEGEITVSTFAGKTLRFTKQDGSASVNTLCTGVRQIGATDAAILFLEDNITSTIVDGTDNGGDIQIVLTEAVAATEPNAHVEVFANVDDMKNGYARMSN